MSGLVLAPLRAEHAIARRAFRKQDGIRVRRIGMGVAAADGACRAIGEARPDWCLLVGFCGGLSPDLATGTVVALSPVVAQAEDSVSFVPDEALMMRARALGARTARAVTVEHLVADPREKKDLRRRFSADALDMESASVAHVAAASRIPFLALRCVLDDAMRDFSPLEDLIGRGEPSARDVAVAMLRKPGTFFPLLQLTRDYFLAARALKNLLVRWADNRTTLP